MGKYVVEFTLPAAWPKDTVLKFVSNTVPAVVAPPAPAVVGADIAGFTKTLVAGQTVVTFEAATEAAAAALAAGVHVFADFPGNELIPQTGAVATTASIIELNPSTLPEQDNVCRAT